MSAVKVALNCDHSYLSQTVSSGSQMSTAKRHFCQEPCHRRGMETVHVDGTEPSRAGEHIPVSWDERWCGGRRACECSQHLPPRLGTTW